MDLRETKISVNPGLWRWVSLRMPDMNAFGADGKRATYVAAMEDLIGVVQQLSLARDVAAVTDIVRSAARSLTGADGATFVLRDGDQCFYAEEDAIAPLWKGQRFPMSACISGWVMLNGQPAVIDDIYADPRIPADAYRPTFVKSLAMVPVRREAHRRDRQLLVLAPHALDR